VSEHEPGDEFDDRPMDDGPIGGQPSRLHPLHPEAPLWLEDDPELRVQDQRRADVTLEEVIAEMGDDAFEPVELVEFDPERPLDDGVHDASRPGPRTVGAPAAVVHMRAIMRIGAGLGVRYMESPGWTTRGRDADFIPECHLQHHTAAERDIDALLINGRPDLAGPLCNWAGHNDGVMVALAAGRANHAGVGTCPSSRSYGVEQTGPVPLSASGPGAFPSYRTGVLHAAATCIYHHWSAMSQVLGHKETARPLGRKVDPMYSMPEFRSAVGRAIAGGSTPPTPVEEVFFLAGLTDADADKLAKAFKEGIIDAAADATGQGVLAKALARGVSGALVLQGQPSSAESVAQWYAVLGRIAGALETLAKASQPPSAP
jgi:hypothetical protein